MEKEKFNITLADGITEIVIREGQASKLIDPKPPVKTNLTGTIGVPLEYIKKRVHTGQFTQELSHLLVDRENITLTLVISENDEYTRGTVTGKLEYNPKFIEFGINNGKTWTPTELGMFFKMNRTFFSDLSENMKLVNSLMNFAATVNSKIERSANEKGDKTDNFFQIVNSNLPESFLLNIPIFKGMKPETIEVETFAKIDGRSVCFILLSPGANQTLEEIRNSVIDEQLSHIAIVAPEIAIIES